MAEKPTSQLPKDLRPFIIHPKIIVTKRSGAEILKQMRSGKVQKRCAT